MDCNKIVVAYLLTSCKQLGPVMQTLNIIKNLDTDIFEPILITLYPEQEGNSILPAFASCAKCFALNLSKSAVMLYGIKELQEKIQTLHIQIIHSLGVIPGALSRRMNCVHFATLRNDAKMDYLTRYGKATGWLLYIEQLKIIKSTPYAFACSKSLADIYAKKYKLSVPYIRNGVDTKKFPPKDQDKISQIRQELGLPQNKLILIATGLFTQSKDQLFTIQGFLQSGLQDRSILLLLGDGPEYPGLKEHYKEDERIVFTGKVDNVAQYLLAADIFVSSSKTEGLPNSVLEAMAAELPVLLSDIPQHQEFFDINSNIGKLYKLGDYDDFQLQIKRLTQSDWVQMGLEGRKTVLDELSSVRTSTQYQEEYKRALLEQ